MTEEHQIIVLAQDVSNLHLTIVGQPRARMRLLELVQSEGALSLDRIMKDSGISRASASRLTDRLVKMNLISKDMEGGSKRAVTVRLTEAGERLLASTQDARATYQDKAQAMIRDRGVL